MFKNLELFLNFVMKAQNSFFFCDKKKLFKQKLQLAEFQVEHN